ncbi:MAG: MBL fold metallo-hydrolase [Dehalococcoidia bacterium]
MADVLPIPLAYNTAYLWEGGGARILVDTGPDFDGAWEILRKALGGRLPDLVVATHGHLDHCGLGHRWQELGVPVAIGAADRRLALEPQFSSDGEFQAFCGYVRASRAPADLESEAISALEAARDRALAQAGDGYRPAGPGGRYPTALRLETFEPQRVIEGDEQLQGGLMALSAPGHTRGNLVLWDPAEHWLFSGDQLLEDMTPTPGIQWIPAPERTGRDGAQGWRFRSLPAFRTALERIAGLEAQRCFPGHGVPFGNVPGVVAANLTQIDGRTARVAAARGGAGSLFRLCEQLYPRATKRRLWQIMATVQGHLDILDAGAGPSFC